MLLEATILQKIVQFDSFVAWLPMVSAVKDAETHKAIIVKATVALTRKETQVLDKIALLIL